MIDSNVSYDLPALNKLREKDDQHLTDREVWSVVSGRKTDQTVAAHYQQCMGCYNRGLVAMEGGA